MPQPLPDGFSVSEAFSLGYDAGMMRVFVIFLGLLLAQALVLFVAGCFTDRTSR